MALSTPALADTLTLGEPIPDLQIDNLGEIQLSDDEVSYTPWQLDVPDKKVHVLQYMAGTMSASKLNSPFTDALKDGIDYSGYYVTTIINLDDAMWGSKGFVRAEIEKNKRRYPLSSLILDDEGIGKETWNIDDKTSTIVVADSSGSIIYLKHGAMSEDEIERTLELIKTEIGS
jgi:uncharacterized protein